MRFASADKRELPQLASVISQAIFDWKRGADQGESDAEMRLRQHAQRMVWDLRRAFETASATGMTDELIRLMAEIAPRSDEIKDAFIAWVALIELLVQQTEQEYGSAPGRGAQKAEQVKAVLIHLMLDRPQIRIADIPDFLVPFIVEIGVNWTIDSICLILNNNEIWEPGPADPSVRLTTFARIIRWLLAAWRSFIRLAPVAQLFGWLARVSGWIVSKAYPLTPDLEAAVQRIETTQGVTIQDVVRRGLALLKWIGDHHDAVVALTEVVARAIKEAEFIGGLSGPEKKVYAQALILAFLEDVGIVGGPSSLTYHLVDSVLDSVIDAIVPIFNKRAESFGKRRQQPLGLAARILQ